jgi:hypothetical protein
MKRAKKIFLVSLFAVIGLLAGYTSQASAEITHTHTTSEIRNELFFNFTAGDLKEMVRRLQMRAQDFKEHARTQLNNLLPMQGKAKSMVNLSKEQSAKTKEQQKMRNRIQQDRLSDLRTRTQQLAQQRADIRSKIRFDR